YERDDQADERIGARQAETDEGGAGEDAKGDESVHAGMLAVGDEGGALQAVSGADADLGGDLVADEADDPGRSEQPQVRERARVAEALDRLKQRDHGADEDHEHDGESGETFAARAA